MVLVPFLLIIVSSIGYLNFSSSAYGRLRLKRLAAGVLTINIIAYGTFHLMAGIVLTVMISMIALQFERPEAPSWLFSFEGVGTSYQPPIAIIIILFLALASAVFGRYLTAKGWRRARATDAKLATELVDSDLELSLLNALEAEDHSPVAIASKTPRLLFRVVLKSRKVYIGNLTRCDLTRGNNKSIVIQPIYSGFQHEQTLELEITEFYDIHYRKLIPKQLLTDQHGPNQPITEKQSKQVQETLSHFSVTIPIVEIVTTSMFNLQSYIDFLEEKEARS